MTEPDDRRPAGRSSPRCAPRTKRCARGAVAPDEVARPPRSRGGWWRAFLSALCIVIATILVPVSIVGAWARVQLVDEDAFVATLAPLVDDPAVQAMIIDESMEAINAQVDFQQITVERVRRHRRPRPAAARRRTRSQLLRGACRERPREPRDHDRHARRRVRRLLGGVGDRDARRASRSRGRCDLRRRRARRHDRRGRRHPARRRRRARQAEPRSIAASAPPQLIPTIDKVVIIGDGRQPRDDPHELRARDDARASGCRSSRSPSSGSASSSPAGAASPSSAPASASRSAAARSRRSLAVGYDRDGHRRRRARTSRPTRSTSSTSSWSAT